MRDEFLVSSRAAHLLRLYNSGENLEDILAPGPGSNTFIQVEETAIQFWSKWCQDE